MEGLDVARGISIAEAEELVRFSQVAVYRAAGVTADIAGLIGETTKRPGQP